MSDLNRREAIAALIAVPAAAVLHPTRYGLMTVRRWQAEGHVGKRVLLNGIDITNVCRWFNDETGEAECFVMGADGNFIYRPEIDDVEKEIRTGVITVRPRP